jgi:hypothetical protein
MLRLDPPKNFSFKAAEWSQWITEFRRFRSASKLASETGEVQRDTLLYVMGSDSEKIFRSLKFEKVRQGDAEVQEKDTDFDTLVRKFDEYFVIKKNVIYERSRLQQRRQQQGETVEEFYRSLKELARHCSYKDEDDQIRDRLVVGLLDSRLKEKLQLLPDLTLTKAMEVARQHEQIKLQNKQGNDDSASASTDEAKLSKTNFSSRGGRGRGGLRHSGGFSRGKERRKREESRSGQATEAQCGRCGYTHKSDNCPAKGQVCRKCKRMNHFSRVCRSRSQN